MKVIYYITDHGLGHASRSVAIIRELKKRSKVIIRSNDRFSFFQKFSPEIKIIGGNIDFDPVMKKENISKLDEKKTQKNVRIWLKKLSKIVQHECELIRKEKPDLIISDISIMPILAAKSCGVKSIAISNFVWNETLQLDNYLKTILKNSYEQADLILKLPFGSRMDFSSKKNIGLVARKITETKTSVRKKLNIAKNKKLIVISIAGFENKIKFQKSSDVEIIDLLDYNMDTVKSDRLDFVEGQNIINAADFVICKCGYGFISDCLSTGTKFMYLLEPSHREALMIHKSLIKKGLKNRLPINKFSTIEINSKFIEKTHQVKIKNETKQAVLEIFKIFEKPI